MHRGLAVRWLAGDASVKAGREAKRTEVDQAVAKARSALAAMNDSALDARLDSAQKNWASLAAAVDSKSIDDAQGLVRHAALIGELLAVLEGITDNSGLILDPEAASYHVVSSGLVTLPRLTETLGQARARGAAALTGPKVQADDRLAIGSSIGTAREQLATTRNEFEKSIAADQSLGKQLSPPLASCGRIGPGGAEASRPARLERGRAGEARSIFRDDVESDRCAVRALRRGARRAERGAVAPGGREAQRARPGLGDRRDLRGIDDRRDRARHAHDLAFGAKRRRCRQGTRQRRPDPQHRRDVARRTRPVAGRAARSNADASARSSAASSRQATRSAPARRRSPPATPTCASAPRSRRATCSRPPRRWSSSPPPSSSNADTARAGQPAGAGSAARRGRRAARWSAQVVDDDGRDHRAARDASPTSSA